MTTREKNTARKQAADRRQKAHADLPDAGKHLAQNFPLDLIPPECCVSVYWPIRSEIDSRPLLHRLVERGCRIALPVVAGPRQPLIFRVWRPGETLTPGAFDVPVPADESPTVSPDVLLAPMLAFDAEGFRLGYGGGFYDMTLADSDLTRSLKLVAGLAFSAQEIPRVPHDRHDRRLDMIATETGPAVMRKPSA